ncbi:MAG TPA: GNAT family N-acetyltransferase [Methanospirillum sp.]|nr:GNAT family N-acetyltransferase [Methanospirillum sp.]
MNNESDRLIRRLRSGEQIPYHLLLLADETIEGIERYIHESEIYVIESEERLIAVCVLQPIDSSVVEIKNIAVDRDHQGKGIGHSLLFDAIRRAREIGYSEIIIGTGDIAARQISLYEDVGFKKYGVKKDFYVLNYPDPIFENGIRLRDMVMLKIDI